MFQFWNKRSAFMAVQTFCAKDRRMIAAPDPQSLTVKIGTPIREVEKLYILRTLEAARGNKPVAAKMLGVTLKTLYNRLNKYGYGKHNRYGKDPGLKSNLPPAPARSG